MTLLLGWMLMVACKLTGRPPERLLNPPRPRLVSLPIGPEEKSRRLHAFLLVGRALLLAVSDQLTGADLCAAQLLAEDIGDISADFP